MEYKQLGNTGHKISEVGLGTSKYTGGPEPLRKGIELGASHIDTAEDYETEDQVGEAVAGMRDRAFIATKVFPNHFRYSDVLEAAQSATCYEIVSNQVRYSLGDRRIEDELLPYCQENNVTVIAYSPLAALWGFSSAKTSLQDEVIDAIAKETNKTRAQVALNWCTSREGVVVIPKSDSVERTVENCGASGWRLTTDQLNRLDEADVNA